MTHITPELTDASLGLLKSPLRLVFFSNSPIAEEVLEAVMHHPQLHLEMLITSLSKPAGRGQKDTDPPMATLAKERSLPLFQTGNINREDALLQRLEENPPDLFLVFSFSQFLSQRVLDLPTIGCFNIHTSLLPRHRGASPIQYAILEQDSITGVSIQRMVKKMDAGPIAMAKKIPIDPLRETYLQLAHKLKTLSVHCFLDFINDVLHQTLHLTEQDHSKATYAPLIPKEAGSIDFQSMTAEHIHRLFRAYEHHPGIFCSYGKRLKLILIRPTKNVSNKVGEMVLLPEGPVIQCKEGGILLEKVRPEGKGDMTGKDFFHGQHGKIQ